MLLHKTIILCHSKFVTRYVYVVSLFANVIPYNYIKFYFDESKSIKQISIYCVGSY